VVIGVNAGFETLELSGPATSRSKRNVSTQNCCLASVEEVNPTRLYPCRRDLDPSSTLARRENLDARIASTGEIQRIL
jgi:hypothetical protein